jgi:hypothetical protein
MKDQGGGIADGSARGAGTGGKGRSDHERDADADARKVVPFPREWYGSPDELVPIDLGPPETDTADTAGADATQAAAFWEGGAGTEHELAYPSNARFDPATSSSAVQTEPARSGDRPTPHKPSSQRSSRGRLAVVALLALVLAGGTAVLVSGLGARNGIHLGAHTRQQDASRAVIKTVTTPVTVKAKLPANGARGRRASTRTHASRPSGDRAHSGTTAVQPPATQPTSEQDSVPSQTSPPVKIGGSSLSAGTGCAQSPDSGCLP